MHLWVGNVEGSICIYWLATSHIRKWFYKYLWTRVANTAYHTAETLSHFPPKFRGQGFTLCRAFASKWQQHCLGSTSLVSYLCCSGHVLASTLQHARIQRPSRACCCSGPSSPPISLQSKERVVRVSAAAARGTTQGALHAQSSKARCACTLNSWSNKYM